MKAFPLLCGSSARRNCTRTGSRQWRYNRVMKTRIRLALVLMLAQRAGKLDSAAWQDLREEGQPPFVDRRVPEERAEDRVWPHLTPAGVQPPTKPETELHRPRV